MIFLLSEKDKKQIHHQWYRIVNQEAVAVDPLLIYSQINLGLPFVKDIFIII